MHGGTQVWLAYSLQPDLNGIGNHHVGAPGHQFGKDTAVVPMANKAGLVQLSAGKIFIGAAGINDDPDARLINVRQGCVF